MRWVYVIAGTILLGLVSLAITWTAGPAALLLWSIAVGGLSVLFVRLIDSYSAEGLGELAPMLMGGAVIGLGWLLKASTAAPTAGWPDAVAMLTALGAAWGVEALLPTGDVRRCFVCRQRVDGEPSSTCPRCRQLICARPECWIARYFRCQYCHEREVILFPIDKMGRSADEPWWRTRLGARLSSGACSFCLMEAGEADLRQCGQCGWPWCTRCWDRHNGQCKHCEWILPDLPRVLRPFLGTTAAVARGRAPAERRRS